MGFRRFLSDMLGKKPDGLKEEEETLTFQVHRITTAKKILQIIDLFLKVHGGFGVLQEPYLQNQIKAKQQKRTAALA
jgi:hypothetical protein